VNDDMKYVRYLVRCTVDIEVDIPDSWDDDPHFHIEENGCPGTSFTGSALTDLIDWSDTNSVCWACGRNGESKILRRIGPVDESMGKTNGTDRDFRAEHAWNKDDCTLTAEDMRNAVSILKKDSDD